MFNILKWKDHLISPKNAYTLTQNTDGSTKITPVGTIIEQGTKMSAENFNRMEEGILDAYLAMELLYIATRAIGDTEDGISPTITIEEITGGHTVSITDADGTKTFTVNDGANGATGEKGPTGATGPTGSAGNGISSAVLNANYTLTLNFTDGTSYTTPSIRGATGATGTSGATMFSCGTSDLTAGVSGLENGKLYFVYE